MTLKPIALDHVNIFVRDAERSLAWYTDILGLHVQDIARHPDGRMRGAFLGLAMNHTSAHAARAVLEGCAYALRDIVDRLDALGLGHGEIRIVGGGARDDLWASIKADVLGRPVRRVLTQEATAVGAAMIAGVGAGMFTDFASALVAVQLDPHSIDPDPAAQRQYADAYGRYLAAFDAVEKALAP